MRYIYIKDLFNKTLSILRKLNIIVALKLLSMELLMEFNKRFLTNNNPVAYRCFLYNKTNLKVYENNYTFCI